MEQKKILWVILAVSAFILVVFGIAFFIYTSADMTAANGPSAEPIDVKIGPGNVEAAAIDPDAWTRKPETIPQPGSGNISAANITNLTVVQGMPSDEQITQLDVSQLATKSKDVKTEDVPEEIAKQLGLKTEKKEAVKLSADTPITSTPPVQAKKTSPVVQKKPPVTPAKKAPAKAKPAKKTPAKSEKTIFWVQTASLSSRLNAEHARDTLAEKYMKVQIFTKETSAGITHRVRVGPFQNKTEAEYWLKNIQAIHGFEKSYVSQQKVKS